jgi:hypothetical protein
MVEKNALKKSDVPISSVMLPSLIPTATSLPHDIDVATLNCTIRTLSNAAYHGIQISWTPATTMGLPM